MNNKSKRKRKILYVVFVILTLVVVYIFGHFAIEFSKIDNNKYEVSKDSILYTSSNSYTKVEGVAILSQKLDGYYYLNDKYDNATHVTKIAKTAISNNATESNIVIYGTAYNVDNNGEVLITTGRTEVSKSSPSKFYKIDDRKYLFVDSEIESDDGSIKTKDYLIIDIDKEGNASFANNLINIKTIKPIVLKGSTLEFDIANELLKHDKNVIELKKVLGSTNNYSKDKQLIDPNDSNNDNESNNNNNNNNNNGNGNGSGGNGGSGGSIVIDNSSYYDDYFKEVINSVNNLTNSVTGVNDKANQSVKKNEIYFDFSKWIVLKSVNPSINSVNVNYQVFDPNNEYQSVFMILKSENEVDAMTIYLNKDNTQIIVGNLNYNTMYTLELCGQTVGNEEYSVFDTVIFVTKKPDVNLTIDKITQEKVSFTIKTLNFKLDSAKAKLYENGMFIDEIEIDVEKAITQNGFSGTLTRTSGGNSEIRITDSIYDGELIDLDVSSKYVN